MEALKQNKYVILAIIGLGFLWPFYQRSFFRVTLFYHQEEDAMLYFGFLLFALTICTVIAYVLNQRLEKMIRSHSFAVLLAGCMSLIGNAYLRGVLVHAVDPVLDSVLVIISTIVFAATIVLVSMTWFLVLNTVNYSKSLWVSIAIVIASSMLGFLISPTFSSSAVVMTFIPVCGLALSSLMAVLCVPALRSVQVQETTGSTLDAPSFSAWSILLVAGLLISCIHGMVFTQDHTREVHVIEGSLTASGSLANYIIFFIFAGLLLLGSILPSRQSKGKGLEKDARFNYWLVILGCLVGVLCGLYLSVFIYDLPSTSSLGDFAGAASKCLQLLLFIVPLLMVYQDSLSPIRTFGLIFIGFTVITKVSSYFIAPFVTPAIIDRSPTLVTIAQGVISFLALATLVFFLFRLCQADLLRHLFVSYESADESDKRRRVCDALASEYSLTNREGEIFYYTSLGHSARKIGEVLFISERTVQAHIQNTYQKLDVHSRQSLIDIVDSEQRGSH